ncbi:MAG: 4-alpha-glucanotransferase [bacterium]
MGNKLDHRGSGILLHISSLPSHYGIGDMGEGAYKFADFLSRSNQSYWQILPLNPIDCAQCNSPYSSISAFAGNCLLISPELLLEEGLLPRSEIEDHPKFMENAVDYRLAAEFKKKILRNAYWRFKAFHSKDDFEGFKSVNDYWLDDYSLFVALKESFGGRSWSQWPESIKIRNPDTLSALRCEQHDRIEQEKFTQYIFFRQWNALKKYCRDHGIEIIGDIPIYVNYDSVDVWSNPKIFKLLLDGSPAYVAGVPPDYFSNTGQLWGNPVYNWEVLRQSGYKWWMQRLEHVQYLYDVVRIDHFRGLVAFWEVPATERTAVNGKWEPVPSDDFFSRIFKNFADISIIAEDLGIITDDVRAVMKKYNFPGMKVLLFAFGEDNPHHPYLPQNYDTNCVVFTGTHDNNTVRGWFETEATADDKRRLFTYLGKEVSASQVSKEFVQLAMNSPANLAIIPFQDVLGLGAEGRMNTPSTLEGNWSLRITPDQMNEEISGRLSAITAAANREKVFSRAR